MVDVFHYDAFQKTISPEPEGGPLVRYSDYSALEAKLAERLVELREARRVISGTHKRAVKHDNCEKPYCPICEGGLFVCADCGAAEIETEQRLCTGPALEATPPAPKVTEVAIDEMAYCFWSIRPRDLDEWAKSGPAMPDGYRGGIRAWFFACEIRRALTAAQEAGKP